jgi:hypothetical protein
MGAGLEEVSSRVVRIGGRAVQPVEPPPQLLGGDVEVVPALVHIEHDRIAVRLLDPPERPVRFRRAQ